MRRHLKKFCLSLVAGIVLAGLPDMTRAAERSVTKFIRFQSGDKVSYGVVEGNRVIHIAGSPLRDWRRTDRVSSLTDVTILTPVARPSKVVALAGNYRSHLGEKEEPKVPEGFFKVPSCLIAHDANIVLPKGSKDVHFEAELVLVIGKRAKNVSPNDAHQYILGVTCGNDVSARDWQKGDVQWWRAKGSDTFGPVGPFIVTGLDYDDLLVTLRLNGEVKQKQRTSELIHNSRGIVSWISRHITLEPGDLIFTGTPGTTSALKAGDVVEVELEGVGILRNKVVAEE